MRLRRWRESGAFRNYCVNEAGPSLRYLCLHRLDEPLFEGYWTATTAGDHGELDGGASSSTQLFVFSSRASRMSACSRPRGLVVPMLPLSTTLRILLYLSEHGGVFFSTNRRSLSISRNQWRKWRSRCCDIVHRMLLDSCETGVGCFQDAIPLQSRRNWVPRHRPSLSTGLMPST